MSSLLTLEISEITSSTADTKVEVASSPSSFLVKQVRMEDEYAHVRSGGQALTKVLISLTASSRSLVSLLSSSCEIRDTMSCLK